MHKQDQIPGTIWSETVRAELPKIISKQPQPRNSQSLDYAVLLATKPYNKQQIPTLATTNNSSDSTEHHMPVRNPQPKYTAHRLATEHTGSQAKHITNSSNVNSCQPGQQSSTLKTCKGIATPTCCPKKELKTQGKLKNASTEAETGAGTHKTSAKNTNG